MNAEKELLLALLVEKYGQPKIATPKPVKAAVKKKRRRRPNKNTHKWTTVEKEMVWDLRNQGTSFDKIAEIMGLSVSQVENMHYALRIGFK